MGERLVSDIMTEEVHTLTVGATLSGLADLFDRFDVRHVPVVDRDGELVGLVSDRDLLRNVLTDQADVPLSVSREARDTTLVESIMTEEVATVGPNTTAREAAGLLLENKFGCAPVVEGSRLVGIVTQSDFLRQFADGKV